MNELFDWLVVSTAKASLLCSAALLLLYSLRRFSAAFRSGLLVASAAGVVILPLVDGVLPPISLSTLFTPTAVESVPLDSVSPGGSVENLIGHSVGTEVLASAGLTASGPSADQTAGWNRWVAWIWIAGAAASGLIYLVRILSCLRLRASSVPLRPSDPGAREVFAAAAAVGLKKLPQIRVSQRVPVPFTCGFGTWSVILPAGFDQLPADARHAVLIHECTHLRRRDSTAQLVFAFCRCLHWFNPLFLWLDRAFKAESEKACDDSVMAAGVTPSTYSETILHFYQTASGTPASALWVGAASGYYPSSQFDRKFRGRKRTVISRIRRIIDPGAPRRTALGAFLGWALIGSATVSASLVGALVLTPDYEWRYQLSERALPHAADLIASWRMDHVDDRNPDARLTPDSTGGIGDGRVVGAELLSEGKIAKALRLDGTDDYVDMGSKFADIQFPFTLSAWVRTEGESEHISQNVVWLGSGELTEYVYIGLNFGKPTIKSRHGESISKMGKQRINDGEWHHIAGVFLSENHRILYADGERVAEDLRHAPKPRLLNLQVGRNGRRDKAASYTRGSVDDVRVYGAALDQDDIRAIMAGDFALVAVRHEVRSR